MRQEVIEFLKYCLEYNNSMIKVNYFNHERLTLKKAHLPYMLEIVEEMGLNTANILKYLQKRYQWSPIDGAIEFKSGCIIRASKNLVEFKSSELHKILTDLNWVDTIVNLDEEFEIDLDILTVFMGDRLLYYFWFKKYTDYVPILPDQKTYTYPEILDLKLYSYRGKWLRIYVMTGHITREQLRTILNNSKEQNLIDFPLPNIIDLI